MTLIFKTLKQTYKKHVQKHVQHKCFLVYFNVCFMFMNMFFKHVHMFNLKLKKGSKGEEVGKCEDYVNQKLIFKN